MALVLSEEQQLLKESVEGFLAEKAPVSQLRSLRDSRDEQGYSTQLWSEMSEMGFAGLLVDEENGGTDFGTVGAGVVAEAMGKTLSASPYLSSAIIGAATIAAAGSDAQKADILPAVASGEKILTLAIDENAHHNPENVALSAAKSENGYVLTGLKTFVSDGHVADTVIVAARTSGASGDRNGISLFLVDKGTGGLIVDRTIMADSRNWARITFENVTVPESAMLGAEGKGLDLLEPALDRARIIIAAELLGIAQQCLDQTVKYLQERKQFGVLIGSFQGLQHRASHLFSEIAVTRSAVLKAMQAADAGGDIRWFASLAKAKACKTAELATNEAIQMHGGIGMTDEFDIGFYIKRARILQQFLGDFNYHAQRFASCSGY